MAPVVVARRALLLPAVVATAATPAELRKALAQLPSQPIVQMDVVVPLYNCDVEYDMWETAWTPDWKAWCCQNRQRGCPSTTTTTRTTSTSTETTTTTATSTTSSTTEDPEACSAACVFENTNATCSARIAWAVSHYDKSCKDARKLVLEQCSSCGKCSMHLLAKIKECQSEEGSEDQAHGEREEKDDEQEEGKHEREGKKHTKPDAVFLAKKFEFSTPVGTPAQRPHVAPVLSTPAALLGAAVVATATLAMGLRSRRRAMLAALMEVPLTPEEATE